MRVPSQSHKSKYPWTVERGGRSLGFARHWQPVDKTYKSAFMTSRRLTMRLSPRFVVGIKGSTNVHDFQSPTSQAPSNQAGFLEFQIIQFMQHLIGQTLIPTVCRPDSRGDSLEGQVLNPLARVDPRHAISPVASHRLFTCRPAWACQESQDNNQSRRLLSLAAMLDGMNRTNAARIPGAEWQAMARDRSCEKVRQ